MKTEQKKRGSALITVIGIVAVISISLISLCFTAQQQSHAALISRDMLKARMLAESGLNIAYNRVKEDFSLAGTIAFEENLTDGSYKVSAKSFQGLTRHAQMTSVGKCGNGQAVVTVDLENIQISSTDDEDDNSNYYELLFDLLVGSELNISGNFYTDINDIHANGSVNINKKSNVSDAVTISSSGSIVWGKAKDTPPSGVVLLPNQPKQEINSAQLLAAIDNFINYAINNGSVYSSGSSIPSNPPGGVALYNGTGELKLHGNYNGTIIVLSSSVKINAQTVLSGPDGYPALITISPNEIRVNGGSEIHGAVIAPNAPMVFNGNAEIHGPLLVGQSVRGNGTADLYAGDAGQGFNMPAVEAVKDKVVITAWH